MNKRTDALPVAVDLDGTLIHTDLLLESLLVLARRNVFLLLLVPFWLLKGKAYLKSQIAFRTHIEVELLPYRKDLLAWLQSEKQAGRSLYLATASHQSFADQVSAHLGIFDGVFATSEQANLSGSRKARALCERFGEKGFVYAGNAPVDMKVWTHAAGSIVVGSETLASNARQVAAVEKHFPQAGAGLKVFAKALRVHQWVKNALIFIPLLASHRIGSISDLAMTVIAFMAFSFCASSVYLLNDMLDLAEDRCHPSKSKRPFAAGTLSIGVGMVAIPVLLALAAVGASFLPMAFSWVLVSYYVMTVGYSFYFKRVVLIDVVMLSTLYTVRIIAGAAAVDVALSFWLLAFSTFIFLSLAILKRYTELLVMRSRDAKKALGRGYHVSDIELLAPLGGASGYVSVLVLALYINSPEFRVLYHHPEIMWPACLVMLYWVSRAWIVAHRGNMHDDPIVFAIKDRVSVLCGALIVGLMFLAAM